MKPRIQPRPTETQQRHAQSDVSQRNISHRDPSFQTVRLDCGQRSSNHQILFLGRRIWRITGFIFMMWSALFSKDTHILSVDNESLAILSLPSVLAFPYTPILTTKIYTLSDESSLSFYKSHNFVSTSLYMGKGDGKKKRKKKDPSSSSGPSTPSASSSPSSSLPTPTPMRVSNDINIPIRRQIRYGKINKQFRQAAGTPSFRQKKVQRTKYRRTWDEEEVIQKAEERKRKGLDPDWDVILNQTKASPLVIVDGYNIIYKWPRLKKHMNKGDPVKSRQLLVDDLENLQSLKGWRIEVVFDGAGRSYRKGPLGDSSQRAPTAADKATTKEVSKHGVRQVFTGVGVEADSYIEARCAEAKNITQGAVTNTFIIATDDAMIRLAGQNAGAWCMSADRFVNELKAVNKAVAYRVEAAMAKVNGQSMRPEKLWGTHVFSPTSNNPNPATDTNTTTTKETKTPPSADTAVLKGVQKTSDGRSIYTGRFGRGSLIIEDKRKKKKPNDKS